MRSGEGKPVEGKSPTGHPEGQARGGEGEAGQPGQVGPVGSSSNGWEVEGEWQAIRRYGRSNIREVVKGRQAGERKLEEG